MDFLMYMVRWVVWKLEALFSHNTHPKTRSIEHTDEEHQNE